MNFKLKGNQKENNKQKHLQPFFFFNSFFNSVFLVMEETWRLEHLTCSVRYMSLSLAEKRA